jgi:hypothetical protein
MGLGRETGLQEQELERADANKPEAEVDLKKYRVKSSR